MRSIFWDLSGSVELDQTNDLFLKWCFQRGFVFLQDLEERGCVCSGAYFWSITIAKYLLGRIPLAFPQELVAARCLAEPCRWCCGPSQAVSVVDGERSCHRLPTACVCWRCGKITPVRSWVSRGLPCRCSCTVGL